MRAAVTTPVGPPAAFLARFTEDRGLPRYCGGSTPTLAVSRPARRSLALQPARTTNLLREAFSRSASGHSSPLDPPRVFPAGARVCRPGFAPGRKMHLIKAHTIMPPNARCAWSHLEERIISLPDRMQVASGLQGSTPCSALPNSGLDP